MREHGGEIDRLVGDAIMATFNTRGDQPDHAERAARAALDLQRATEPRWPRSTPTGRASASGSTPARRWSGVVGAREGKSYTVIGDTVNAAARLEGAAPVGGVAIGAGTLRACPARGCGRSARFALKGKATPVDAYVLEALR